MYKKLELHLYHNKMNNDDLNHIWIGVQSDINLKMMQNSHCVQPHRTILKAFWTQPRAELCKGRG